MVAKMTDVKCVETSELIDSALFFSRPNRSLSKRGRLLWLALIASSTTLVGLAAVAMGAWLILPFAGLEVALVSLAFHVIDRHDGDYEKLCVNEQEFRWEQRCGRQIDQLKGSRQWVTFVRQVTGSGCEIHLRYGGKSVKIGQLMTLDQRERLAVDLGQVFKHISESR